MGKRVSTSKLETFRPSFEPIPNITALFSRPAHLTDWRYLEEKNDFFEIKTISWRLRCCHWKNSFDLQNSNYSGVFYKKPRVRNSFLATCSFDRLTEIFPKKCHFLVKIARKANLSWAYEKITEKNLLTSKLATFLRVFAKKIRSIAHFYRLARLTDWQTVLTQILKYLNVWLNVWPKWHVFEKWPLMCGWICGWVK